jgi:predicted Fe-Mo cluster-binding NifX family protein
MKIAIPSTQPDLSGSVEHKLGTAAYLVVVETDDMSFESVNGPPASSGPGAGVMATSLAMDMGAKVILVGHIAPHIANTLKKHDLEVVTHISGTVAEAVSDYMKSLSTNAAKKPDQSRADEPALFESWSEAIRKGLRQFGSLLPRLVGVILLLSLFRGFISDQALLTLFSGSPLVDSLCGASLGSVMAGNPVNSYVIGKGLLQSGIGLAGVTALMLAWVNVGLIQLPAEAAALGLRFALVRNLAGFVMAVAMSFLVVLWQGWGA